MKNYIDIIDQKSLLKDYDYLHNNAETGFELNNTLKYVISRLKEMKIEYSLCGKCGVCAIIGKENDKTLLLRADMDALCIGGNNIHACGHDMHTAMLLEAARVIKQNEETLKCRVKLMFQSAEEILEGAKDMIEAGVLKNPDVDCAFMLHVATACDYKTGTVIFASKGEISPSADYFEIEVTGASVHGATPENGRDPITAGAHIVCALQSINSRELSLADDAVITLGSVEAGKAPNAIPDTLKMQGTMRTYSQVTRDFVKQRIQQISSGVATALRTNAEVRYTRGCPAFKNDGVFLQKVSKIAAQLLGEDKVVLLREGVRGGGSEDFAYVSQLVPTAMALLCAGQKNDGYDKPLHNPAVVFDKKALPYGSALMVALAFEVE